MDVGSARGKFELAGLDKAIKELKEFRTKLKSTTFDYAKHRKEQGAVINGYKAQSAAVDAAVGRLKTYASASRAAGIAIVNLGRQQAAAAAKIQSGIGIGTKPSVDQYFARPEGVAAAESYLKLKSAAAAANRPLAKIAAMSRKAGAALRRMTGSVKSTYTAFRRFIGVTDKASSRSSDWWHRFGLVAVGFSVAYRAINAVELAIREVTRTFIGGLQALDNYKQSLATVSGMLSLLSTGGGGFNKRFEFFHKQMQGTMRESMRLAPMFRLSMDEIAESYKEMAQFGVYAKQDTVKNTLTAVAAIKEIAVTTGSTTRQIRQEIQGVFNGQARVSDQFGRFLKRFPELRDKLYGINKMSTDNVTKWQLATEAIANYYQAIIEANKTVTAQLQISKNTLNIISLRSLEMTGIYKQWLGKLTSFNDRLVDSKGNLGDLGQVFLQAFADGWYLVSKIADISLIVGKHWANLASQVQPVVKSFSSAAAQAFKMFASIKALGIALSAISGTGKFILRAFTSPLAIAAVSASLLKNLIVEFVHIDDSEFKKKITDWHWWLEKIRTSLAKILTGWKTIIVTVSHPLKFGSVVQGKLAEEMLKNAGLDPSEALKSFEEQIKNKGFFDKRNYRKLFEQFKQGDKNRDFLFRAVTGGLTPEESLNDLGQRLKKVGRATVDDFTTLFNTMYKAVTGLSAKDTKFLFPDINPEKFKQNLAAMGAELKGLKLGLGSAGKATEALKLKSAKAYQVIGDKFGEYVKDSMTGDVKSLKDVFTNFLKFIRDAFAQTFADIANNMMRQFIYSKIGNTTMSDLFSNFFGGGGGGAAYSGPTPSGATLGSGAWGTPATIALASGGIIGEPVFGIGQSGKSYSFGENGPERVLSNKDSFASSSPNVTVNVINKSSQPVDARVGDTRKLIKGMVTDVILEDRRRGGILSRG